MFAQVQDVAMKIASKRSEDTQMKKGNPTQWFTPFAMASY